MIALIVDTETGAPGGAVDALDPQKARLVELAVARYDLERACLLETFSTLVRPDEPVTIPDVVGIPEDALIGAPGAAEAIERAFSLPHDVRVAHVARYDRTVLSGEPRTIVSDVEGAWVCTYDDVRWPRSRPRSLNEIALAHGVAVSRAHRALDDVLTLCALFDRCAELDTSPAALVREGMLRERVVASCLAGKEAPKAAGFRWHSAEGLWVAKLSPAECAALPFAAGDEDDLVEVEATVSYSDRQIPKDAGFSWQPKTQTWTGLLFPREIDSLPFEMEP